MKTKSFIYALMIILTLGFMTAMPSFAISLNQAKSQGLIGEQANGYLGIVTSSPSSQVRQLVSSVNSKRKSSYQKIATQNGTSVQAVQKIAGQTAISKTPSGYYIKSSGGWVKK